MVADVPLKLGTSATIFYVLGLRKQGFLESINLLSPNPAISSRGVPFSQQLWDNRDELNDA